MQATNKKGNHWYLKIFSFDISWSQSVWSETARQMRVMLSSQTVFCRTRPYCPFRWPRQLLNTSTFHPHLGIRNCPQPSHRISSSYLYIGYPKPPHHISSSLSYLIHPLPPPQLSSHTPTQCSTPHRAPASSFLSPNPLILTATPSAPIPVFPANPELLCFRLLHRQRELALKWGLPK